MAKTAYNIQLKGYVGGADFDRKAVDKTLAEHSGKPVNVLIDSLGGSLATGLSISAAFKQHGNVSVHFVSLNASAATIASLGAAHISIDAGAMYLVHKCSMAFFEWGSLNADQFATLIADCEKIKADLDKLDQNVARLYAARCKRKPEDLLALMKVGGWLSAKEAHDWGFVDEITDLADEPAPRLTDTLASAMASEGMPIPNIPLAEQDKESAFGKFLTAIASIFNSKSHTQMPEPKTYSEDEYNALNQRLNDANALADSQKATIEERDKRISELEAKLAKTPAEPSKQVVEDKKPSDNSDESDFDRFCATVNAARDLYNEV